MFVFYATKVETFVCSTKGIVYPLFVHFYGKNQKHVRATLPYRLLPLTQLRLHLLNSRDGALHLFGIELFEVIFGDTESMPTIVVFADTFFIKTLVR